MDFIMNQNGSYWNVDTNNSPFYNNCYTVYKSDEYNTTDKVVYSDRLHQWDSKKYKKATHEAFNGYEGQYFDNFTPNQIQKFLSIYFNKDVILTRIDKEENVSNGYPYWVFFYKEKEN